MSGFFVLTIDTANAAFEGDDLVPEISRILDRAASDLAVQDVRPGGSVNGILRDANGHTVGVWDLVQQS